MSLCKKLFWWHFYLTNFLLFDTNFRNLLFQNVMEMRLKECWSENTNGKVQRRKLLIGTFLKAFLKAFCTKLVFFIGLGTKFVWCWRAQRCSSTKIKSHTDLHLIACTEANHPWNYLEAKLKWPLITQRKNMFSG